MYHLFLHRFETSEMLANFVASTPLLEQTWKLCQRANATPDGLVTDCVGDAIHIAFSGGGSMWGLDMICGNLVQLMDTKNKNREMFSAFERHEDEVVMVHSGFLHQFMCMYNNSTFQNQVSKSISSLLSYIIPWLFSYV